MDKSWDWIESIAEERRDEVSDNLLEATVIPLESQFWFRDTCTFVVTDRFVLASSTDVEECFRTIRGRTKLPVHTEAAGMLSIVTKQVLEDVWGLEIDTEYAVVQYIEHRLFGSRVWCLRLDLSYTPVGEWDLLHIGPRQLVEPLFPMGRAFIA